MEKYGFTVSSPESVGIRSEALLRFLDAADKEKLEIHSMLLVRKNKLVFDGFWKPFAPDKLHRLCSAGKAVVAIAVLLAVQEGILALDDPAIKHLPESAAEVADERGRNVTIYDLLTMHAGHRMDSFRAMHTEGYLAVEEFFRIPFVDAPGTQFFYDNGIPDVLAAMLYHETGLRVSEYLRPRILDPLDIREIRVEAEKEMDDLPTFCLTTIDLLKLTELFFCEGAYHGKQLLDASLAKQAVSYLVPTADEREATEPTPGFGVHTRGYGFQIWGNLFGGFILDGGCGQMGIGVPELDMMVAINANDPMAERIVELLWEHLRGNLFAKALPENPDVLNTLRIRQEQLTLLPIPMEQVLPIPQGIYRFEKAYLGVEQITLREVGGWLQLLGTNSVTLPTDGSWTSCRIPFMFTEMQSAQIHRREEHGLRLDTHVGYSVSSGYVAAVWNNGTLNIMFRSDAWMGSHLVKFVFTEDGVKVTHENGTSWRLRNRECLGHWAECIYDSSAFAVRCD